MPHRRTRPAPPSPSTAGQPARRVTAADIDRAADALLREGERPTIEKVRIRIGRGSPNTITPLLDAWWERLSGRLDAGPAALHRLPEPVVLAAEGLWMQTLDEARRRVAAEQGSRKASLAQDRQDLEVRSHVLSIRESELASRLQVSDRRAAQLESELATLTTLLRKEQASRLAAERRLQPDDGDMSRAKSRRPARRSTRPPAPSKSKVIDTRVTRTSAPRRT